MHNDGITKVVARRFHKHNATSIYSKFNRNITFSRKILKNAATSSTPPFLLFVIVFVFVSFLVNLKCYHHFHHPHQLLIVRMHSSISSLVWKKYIYIYLSSFVYPFYFVSSLYLHVTARMNKWLCATPHFVVIDVCINCLMIWLS